jgi:hypothetical protein
MQRGVSAGTFYNRLRIIEEDITMPYHLPPKVQDYLRQHGYTHMW